MISSLQERNNNLPLRSSIRRFNSIVLSTITRIKRFVIRVVKFMLRHKYSISAVLGLIVAAIYVSKNIRSKEKISNNNQSIATKSESQPPEVDVKPEEFEDFEKAAQEAVEKISQKVSSSAPSDLSDEAKEEFESIIIDTKRSIDKDIIIPEIPKTASEIKDSKGTMEVNNITDDSEATKPSNPLDKDIAGAKDKYGFDVSRWRTEGVKSLGRPATKDEVDKYLEIREKEINEQQKNVDTTPAGTPVRLPRRMTMVTYGKVNGKDVPGPKYLLKGLEVPKEVFEKYVEVYGTKEGKDNYNKIKSGEYDTAFIKGTK